MEETRTFLSHVFDFEQDSRNEFTNIMQYTVIGVIMVTILLNLGETYTSPLDTEKGDIAIFVEVCIECVLLFISIVFVDRVITYIPTISGTKYPDISVIAIILPVLIILLNNTEVGSKTKLLYNHLARPPPVPDKKPSTTRPIPLLPREDTTTNPMASEPDFSTGLTNQVQDFEPLPSNFGGSML